MQCTPYTQGEISLRLTPCTSICTLELSDRGQYTHLTPGSLTVLCVCLRSFAGSKHANKTPGRKIHRPPNKGGGCVRAWCMRDMRHSRRGPAGVDADSGSEVGGTSQSRRRRPCQHLDGSPRTALRVVVVLTSSVWGCRRERMLIKTGRRRTLLSRRLFS
ncbi:hypothetical protein LY76DRAFT_427318 [Colletotrichum caudatum]|nr:hypothetical protein LY76DRAFT_427318 [Colletotrichum caudatum]